MRFLFKETMLKEPCMEIEVGAVQFHTALF